MRERFISLGCALAALGLFILLFVHGSRESRDARDSRPTTVDPGIHGYEAAWEWLGASHVPVRSLRTRLGADGLNGIGASGSLLWITLPTARAWRSDELHRLESWVRSGNTLLLLAPLAERSDGVPDADHLAAGELALLTGLEFAPQRESAHPSASPPRQPVQLLAARPHPYFTGVRAGTAIEAPLLRSWSVKIPYDGFVLTLAHTQYDSEVLWIRALGAGRLIVSGVISPFSNAGLASADNAQLLANIVAASIQPGGVVLFDDMHQGLGNVYDTERFWSDPRLHLTVLILALLWLSWVAGSGTLQLSLVKTTAPRESQLIEALGGFMARVLSPVAAGRRMLQHFACAVGADVADNHHTGDLLMKALRRHARLDPADLEQLEKWCSRLARNRPVPLLPLHNLLVRVQRALQP